MKLLRSQGPMTGYIKEASPCGSAPGSVDCQPGNHQILELSQELCCAHISYVHSKSSREMEDHSQLFHESTLMWLVLMETW